MANNRKFNIPDFVEVFKEVRGDPTKHLNQRISEGGGYLVPDVDIAEFATKLRKSRFYCDPWLDGCQPATVLFEGVIKDLESDNPKRVRQAVNKAHGAEHRIVVMGPDAYITWRKAGMPAESQTTEPKPASQVAPKPSTPPATKAATKRPSKPAVPLPVLKAETASRLKSLLGKQHLLDEMPDSVRHLIEYARRGITQGQLLQPTAEAVLVAVEQWLKLRKEHRDMVANLVAMSGVITPALQQYDYLLNTFPGDERVVEHLALLRKVLGLGDPKAIAKAIEAGDRLSGLLDGTIAPVVPINKPKQQTPTNIATPDYIRERLGTHISDRGRAVAGAGKGQKEKSRRKSG